MSVRSRGESEISDLDPCSANRTLPLSSTQRACPKRDHHGWEVKLERLPRNWSQNEPRNYRVLAESQELQQTIPADRVGAPRSPRRDCYQRRNCSHGRVWETGFSSSPALHRRSLTNSLFSQKAVAPEVPIDQSIERAVKTQAEGSIQPPWQRKVHDCEKLEESQANAIATDASKRGTILLSPESVL